MKKNISYYALVAILAAMTLVSVQSVSLSGTTDLKRFDWNEDSFSEIKQLVNTVSKSRPGTMLVAFNSGNTTPNGSVSQSFWNFGRAASAARS